MRVDAGPMAQEVGFQMPVALTGAAWADGVAWSDTNAQKQSHQDQSGRMWDLLLIAAHAIRTSRPCGHRTLFSLYRVPRDGRSTAARLTPLKLIIGPGESGERVMTILVSDEDCPWPGLDTTFCPTA